MHRRTVGQEDGGNFVTMSSGDMPFRARRRAPFGFLTSLSVFLLFVAGCSGSETSASGTSQEVDGAGSATDRPNIVFVLADDLDYASAQKMPEIGSLLAEEGLSLEETFVSHPICCPSRATILTGLYDHNHGVSSNNPPSGGFEGFFSKGHEEDTIGARLQEGGYRTAFFGKYLNNYGVENSTHVPPGWDEWYGKGQKEQRLQNYEINENGEMVSYGNGTEDFYTDVLSGQVTNFVRRAAEEESPQGSPFFAYVAPTAPHAPATPAERHQGAFADEEVPRPPSFNEEDVSDKPSWIRDSESLPDEELSEIDGRYRERLESMLAVDEIVGALVEELEAAGELDNTYIFFTSDNGWEGGEHRIPQAKNRAYEESARVPLYVRGPGVPAGLTMKELVLNTDFAPTFAELAGTEFAGADGRSIVPLLRGEEPSSWRSAILLERPSVEEGDEEDAEGGEGGGESKAKGKAKAGSGRPSPFEAVRTGTHKYVEYANGEIELYDLQADPYELESIHEGADASLVEDLAARLEALRTCSGDGCREAEDAA